MYYPPSLMQVWLAADAGLSLSAEALQAEAEDLCRGLGIFTNS